MTLQAIRRGLPVKAAAVVGPVTDFSGLLPRLEQTMRSAVPGWERNREREIEVRSPVRWAESLAGVPLLLIHGGADEAVPAAHTLAFAQKLDAAGGVYELIVYAKDDHPVSNHLEERLRKAIEWFRNPPSK
jgi:dipeptidyl aminopeptidase/acylaminoacyl peptidase